MERLEMVKEILKRVNTDPIFNQRAEETLEEAGVTRELAEITKKKYEVEKEYNKATLKEIEVARQEKVPATLIKDVVKSRLAEKLFEVRILETKEAYILNRLRNERSNVEILRTILSYKKEEMKDL